MCPLRLESLNFGNRQLKIENFPQVMSASYLAEPPPNSYTEASAPEQTTSPKLLIFQAFQ